jgi:hypothetical protein
MPNGLDLEDSHDRRRVVLRVDQVTPPTPAEAEPMNDPSTGRFVKGNRAHRRRQLAQRAKGIATLNPSKVPTWLRPHVEHGAGYVTALLEMLGDRPALHPLAGDTADAHVLYRAVLALAVAAEDAKSRAALMAEARGWLREHRTALATLSALAGGMKLPEPDPFAALARIAREEAPRG